MILMLSASAASQAAEPDYHQMHDMREGMRELPWPKEGESLGGYDKILKGSSIVYRFDRNLSRVSVSDALVCDILPVGPREVLVNAKSTGNMNLIVWDEAGSIATYHLESTVNVHRLGTLLQKIDPESFIEIVPYNETVAIYGLTQNAGKLLKMQEMTTAFDEKAMNFMEVAEAKQVLLEVRFIEIDRTNDDDFKLDAEILTRFINARSLTGATGASGADGIDLNGVYPEASVFNYDDFPAFNQSGITQSIANMALTYASGSFYITPVLRWLETKNLLKIIARPNLIARDGESADFLVGGEFAIPVSNDGDISVEYQEYGTRLEFTPELLKDDLMRLKIKTEVSELDFANTVTIASTTVPSLLKRQQSTVAELRDNQSLVIGGMITQRISQGKREFPLFSKIPYLGELFKSETFDRTDIELLVVVTPHIVKPFELGENKEFYNPELVAKAIQMTEISPLYDKQTETMHQLIRQQEMTQPLIPTMFGNPSVEKEEETLNLDDVDEAAYLEYEFTYSEAELEAMSETTSQSSSNFVPKRSAAADNS